MLGQTISGATFGVEAYTLHVEVHAGLGLPKLRIVGLPDSAVRESEERVRSALASSGFHCLRKRTIVNLAPADRRKEGASLDLPIAIALMQAYDLIPRMRTTRHALIGELGLDGSIKPVSGALVLACHLREEGFEGVMVARENVIEAASVEGLEVRGFSHLTEVVAWLRGEKRIEAAPATPLTARPNIDNEIDLSDVCGQEHAKRALEIAAAGGHNLLMIGPPGAGKTMLARRLPTLLPLMNMHEIIETNKIYSIAGRLNGSGLIVERPFCAPHHGASDAGLIGGGVYPRPGQISMAHYGVLFLDELPEFHRDVLESLRQPLEEGQITISRAAYTATFPACFHLVAAMNPCPCGYLGDPTHHCQCSHQAVTRYRGRISGPLLDRIDLHIEVPAIRYREMRAGGGETSEAVRTRVEKARKIAADRYKSTGIFTNTQITNRQAWHYAEPDADGHRLLETVHDKLGLSARGLVRVLKIARTIADMEGSERVRSPHIAEAVQYRTLDRSPS